MGKSILFAVLFFCSLELYANSYKFAIPFPTVYNTVRIRYELVPYDQGSMVAIPRLMTVSFYDKDILLENYVVELRRGAHVLHWKVKIKDRYATNIRIQLAERFVHLYPPRFWQSKKHRSLIRDKSGRGGFFVNIAHIDQKAGTGELASVPRVPIMLMKYVTPNESDCAIQNSKDIFDQKQSAILACQEKTSLAKDFSHYRWQDYPDIHVFIFKDGTIQSDYFLRLAHFVEKAGHAGTLLSNNQLAGKKGWNAHDYRLEDIARFYTTALTNDLALNKKELSLLRYLIAHDMLVNATLSGYKTEHMVLETGLECCIASIHNALDVSIKDVLLDHEIIHMFYFRDEQLVQSMEDMWNGLRPRFTQRWKSFLTKSSYDVGNTYLVVNELLAYLMQRPIEALTWYAPARFFGYSPDSKTLTAYTLNIAKEVEQYMSRKYNVYSGLVRYVRPLR